MVRSLTALCLASLFWGCGKTVAEKKSGTAAPKPFDLKQLLPPAKSLGMDFKLAGASRAYDGQELNTYAPNAAKSFHDYGFSRLITQTYVRQSDKMKFTVEAYNMGRPINAFGVMARRRPKEALQLRIGKTTPGWLHESKAAFCQGDYMVRIEASAPTASNDKLVRSIANEMTKRIPPSKGTPVEKRLSFLPDGRLPNSAEYFRKDALGFSFLTDAVAARYKLARTRRPARLFYAQLGSKQAAKDAMVEFRQFKLFSKTTKGRGLGLGGEAFEATEDFAGRYIVFRAGTYVGGIVGADRGEEGIELARQLSKVLK